MNSEIDQIVPALIKAKLAFGAVVKDKNNPAFKSKYADLGAVLDAVEPALLANDLLLIQPTQVIEGKHVIVSRIIHASGQYIESMWELHPTKQDPQGEGSALTYGRRYSVLTMLGLAPEDDDGNAASRQQATEEPARPKIDYMKKLAEASTVAEVIELARQATAEDKFKGALRKAMTDKKDALSAAEAEAPATTNEPAPEEPTSE